MGSSICPPVQIPALAASAEEGCPAGLDGEPARSNSQIERRNLAAENHRARSTRHRFDAPSLRSVGQTYAFFVRCHCDLSNEISRYIFPSKKCFNFPASTLTSLLPIMWSF